MEHESSLQRASIWLMSVSLAVVLAFYGVPEIVHRVALSIERAKSEAAGIQLERAGEASAAFRLVVKRVSPAVVNVSALRAAPEGPRGFEGSLFDRLSNEHVVSAASGIIIDPRGFVVTNHHVVRGARRLRVSFADGRETVAQVVGSDPRTDIAVLKVDQDGLIAAEFGDSDAVEVGDWVLAIGNPFGLERSVTAGIISAKGRSRKSESTSFEDFLQTDAAINPGNSGGPLVNLRGEVIGVNSRILTETGGYLGISFAIPSNMAETVVERLITEGKVTRGWLGVKGIELSSLPAGFGGIKATKGVVVDEVVAASPAERAGMRPGDVIKFVAGREIAAFRELQTQIGLAPIGSPLKIVMERAGQAVTIEVTIQEWPADLPFLAREFGLSVIDVSDDRAKRAGIARDRGVIVSGVVRDSPAARAGLLPKDVILSVGDESISSIKQFVDELQKADLARGLPLIIEDSRGARRVVVLDGSISPN